MDDIVIEGEGTADEMQAQVQKVLEEKGWTNRAHVGFAFEPPVGGSGPYKVVITPPPDDEPIVKSI